MLAFRLMMRDGRGYTTLLRARLRGLFESLQLNGFEPEVEDRAFRPARRHSCSTGAAIPTRATASRSGDFAARLGGGDLDDFAERGRGEKRKQTPHDAAACFIFA